MVKFRNSIYSGPAEGVCKLFNFRKFVHFDITQFLRLRGLDAEFNEEGLDYGNVNYNVYNFNLGFTIEQEINTTERSAEISFIGTHPICSQISNFFRLYKDAQQRMN